ncbi:MAG: CynX/NimT family MFS transporter [Hyphomicrobiales bacterium]
MAERAPAPSPDQTGAFWALVLLWVTGASLRATILATPPVIPLIHDDLQLSQKAIGALNGLPVLMFAFGALFGSLLLARIGVIRALVVGLLLTGGAGALRGLGPDVFMLFSMTILMGLGIAIMQPAMPTLVGRWTPEHTGRATAVYVNGLLVGEIIAAALTLPFALPLTGGWGGALAFWSLIPALNVALLLYALHRGHVRRPGLRGTVAPARWWPDWRNGAMLRCGLVLGCASSMYFATNGFLPDFLHESGRNALIGPALSALNAGQLPASFLLLVIADRAVGRAWPLVGTGLLCAAALAGLVAAESDWLVILCSAIVGFCAAANLILVLALPPLLAPQDDVHRFSAGVFLTGYFISFVTPVISGALWDATHVSASAFLPIGLAAIVLAAMATRLATHEKGRSRGG